MTIRFSPTDAFIVNHCWPVEEQAKHIDFALVLNSAVTDLLNPARTGELNLHHAGCWECDLSDDSLTWSGGVYDIFGLPRGAKISRIETASMYAEESRVAMERLRAFAIRHYRGFTLDAEICPPGYGRRWMRLICAPVCDNNRVVRLHGLKLSIPASEAHLSVAAITPAWAMPNFLPTKAQ